jgi:hypothetical protein
MQRVRTEEEGRVRRRQRFVCGHCCNEFTPRAKKYFKYCSRECAFAKKKSEKKSPDALADCPANGMLKCLLRTRWQVRQCGCCKKLKVGLRQAWCEICRQAAKNRERTKAKDRSCVQCGVDLFGAWQRSCEECRRKASVKARRVSKSRCGARRRIREKGVGSMVVERIVSQEVYQRDHWKCHICLGPCVPPTRKYNPMSATIDHIHPIALGGAHVMNNVATAHSICNSIKRDLV